MAFLNGINKAIEKATMGATNVAHGVSNAVRGSNEISSKSKAAHAVHKCPECGQLLNGIAAVCPLCGYEFESATGSNSIANLIKEIDRLQQKRHVVRDAFAAKLSGRNSNPTDEKIASLIRNYVVPNTKKDIFEFMLLAAGNMDANTLVGKQTEESFSETIVKSWESKFHQTYQKATFSFGNDADFAKIQTIYDAKMQEIEDAKPHSIFKRRK